MHNLKTLPLAKDRISNQSQSDGSASFAAITAVSLPIISPKIARKAFNQSDVITAKRAIISSPIVQRRMKVQEIPVTLLVKSPRRLPTMRSRMNRGFSYLSEKLKC